MPLFNIYGLIIAIIILIPNIVFAIKCKDGFVNIWHNKFVEIAEQIGRFSCFTFMFINIPKTCFGWINNKYFLAYLIINFILVFAYCLIWFICFKKSSIFKSLALSIIPSIIFIFSGIMMRSILLITSSVIFGPNHIILSYMNTKN